MGADMSGGGNREIFTRAGCSQVAEWCEPFMPDRSHVPWDEMIGVYDIPADAVKKADAVTPREYDPAKTKLARDHWHEVRSFLSDTAAAESGIHGGY